MLLAQRVESEPGGPGHLWGCWGASRDGPEPGGAICGAPICQQSAPCIVPLDRTVRQSSIEAWASIVARWRTSAGALRKRNRRLDARPRPHRTASFGVRTRLTRPAHSRRSDASGNLSTHSDRISASYSMSFSLPGQAKAIRATMMFCWNSKATLQPG